MCYRVNEKKENGEKREPKIVQRTELTTENETNDFPIFHLNAELTISFLMTQFSILICYVISFILSFFFSFIHSFGFFFFCVFLHRILSFLFDCSIWLVQATGKRNNDNKTISGLTQSY